jgi:ABC-type multidrug transport system ATPase subunit
MEITLKNIGRRFNRDWIFKGVNYSFNDGESYAILGRNGSGKSTLLQIIAGSLTPSEGTVEVLNDSTAVDPDDFYRSIAVAAPYLELVEEFTLSEMIDFHFKFKPYLTGIDRKALIEILDLESSKNKLIKYFSSGMKQRTKLALAIFSDTPVLLLDEPTSNLDSQAIDWYHQMVSKYTSRRLTLVCSNQEVEYSFCRNRLSISDYKGA